MNTLDSLLTGIVADPREETRWLVLADWLQENDQPDRAELLRLHRKLIATCCDPDSHPERAEWQARVVELLVAGVKPCVPQETLTLPGGVPMTFSFIPPGAFLMGSDKREWMDSPSQKPVHRVELSQGFFLGVFAVTQEQWFAVMGTDPSHFKGPQRPVEQLSREDGKSFCENLTRLIGRSFGLPTETEWETACRAGTRTEYYFGDTLTTDFANGGNESWDGPNAGYRERTLDVGSFPANPWGLHDMHGNVWEWCEGRYGPYPGGTDEACRGMNLGVVRGGSFSSNADSCTAAYRLPIGGSVRGYSHCGFRVVLPLG